MINLKSLLLLENEWPSIILNDRYTWYHGRTVDSDIFSYDYVGGENANDQEGPGFYFTNNFENARNYAYPHGIVLKCKVDYKKLIVKNSTSTTKTNKRVIIDLINNSPNKEYILGNFDENPKIAMVNAVNAYSSHTNASDAYQLIANDFYRRDSKKYLQVLSKYYDAQLTKLDNTTHHLIVYNPSLITVLTKFKLEN